VEDRVCCHVATGDVDVVDGTGWPEFEESCLVLDGDLKIAGAPGESVNLARVTGDVFVDDYDAEDLTILDNLEEVGDELFIRRTAVASLAGLERLRTIGGRLRLTDNAALENVTALSELTSLDELMIQGNQPLESLGGLESLESIGTVTISRSALVTLGGLNPIQR